MRRVCGSPSSGDSLLQAHARDNFCQSTGLAQRLDLFA